ncbi:hypothetical protein J4H86_02935 [Spiractinospora alimapuensis]|uniref:hypothetical protein n=1 Tax=Spiractinospora alimapuensis TaxID=2820884 RepID=UPI001F217B18|nr:hypothetical protein [Spiractinospora alimapuensis]QVQ52799.1 hypothetical protein J4H86_02935 [Spiractinospora alimapuensis]
MASTSMPSDLYTEVVQVFRGGEPDDDGFSLAGRISPLTRSFNSHTCACACVPFPHSLWEFLDRLNPYALDSDIWLRVIGEDCDLPLPEGATLIATRRVSLCVE